VAVHGLAPSSFTGLQIGGAVGLKLAELCRRKLMARNVAKGRVTFVLTEAGYKRCAPYARNDHPIINVHWRGRKRPL